MQPNSFDQLGQHLVQIINRPGAKFFDIMPMLSELEKPHILSLLNDFLAKLIDTAKGLDEEGTIYLYRQGDIHLFIRFVDQFISKNTLQANMVDAVVMNLSDEVLQVPAFQCAIDQQDLARQPQDLKRDQDWYLRPYQAYCVTTFSSILDFYEASHNAPLLIIHSNPRAWSTWVFDKRTLKPLRRVSTDLQASRIQLTLAFLRAMQVKTITPWLKTLILSNYAGNVRWEALKYYYEIDNNEAKELLQQLAQYDTEPAVRRAAQKTWQLKETG